MKTYKGYLIDLDGTVYRGNEKIDAAVVFVKRLEEQGIPYLFVTNNSSKRRGEVAEKLQSLGVPASEEHVFTTSMATARYIAERSSYKKIYVIGEEGLHAALKEKGFQITTDDPGAVVIGIDRDITYEKLANGCLAIRNGADFISTNSDIAIPTERGMLPGNGSLTSVLSVSTGVKPTFIGKPEPIIIEQALEVLGVEKEETLLVGDNYDTDILAGIRAGMDTLLVHTGLTTKEALWIYDQQPTYTADSLSGWPLSQKDLN